MTSNRFVSVQLACAAFLTLLSPLAAQVSLGSAANLMVGNNPDEIAIGDIDSDGDLDLVVGGCGPANCVAVWRNDGAGNFAVVANVTIAAHPRSVALADFDFDGDLDLAVAATSPSDLFVLRNDGVGTFSVVASFPIGRGARGLTVADLDHDFDLDLAVACRDRDRVYVLRNDGAGSFIVTRVAVGNEPRNVVAADFDHDGLPDLATANHSSRNVSIARNLGGGEFAPHVTFPVSHSVRPEWVTAADVDGDGDLDLVVAVGETPGQVAVLANNGTGSMGPAVFYATGNEPCAVLAADVDGDRAVDLITANEKSDDVSFLRNLGNGTFRLAQTVVTGQTPEALAVGDFDGDGKVDVLALNRDSGSVTVVRNQGANAVTAPVIHFATPATQGRTLVIELTHPTGRASGYVLLLSHATTPPILLPDMRTIPLRDSLLLLMPGSGPPFQDGIGFFDGSGTAFARLAVPQGPGLGGHTLYFAFIELDPRTPLFIGAISDAASITLQ